MASGLDDSGDSTDEEDDDVTQIISDDFAYRRKTYFLRGHLVSLSWCGGEVGGGGV